METIKKLEKQLEDLIIADNTSWLGTTGENYTEQIDQCRYELNKLRGYDETRKEM